MNGLQIGRQNKQRMKTGIIYCVGVGYMYINEGVVIREGRERELK